ESQRQYVVGVVRSGGDVEVGGDTGKAAGKARREQQSGFDRDIAPSQSRLCASQNLGRDDVWLNRSIRRFGTPRPEGERSICAANRVRGDAPTIGLTPSPQPSPASGRGSALPSRKRHPSPDLLRKSTSPLRG